MNEDELLEGMMDSLTVKCVDNIDKIASCKDYLSFIDLTGKFFWTLGASHSVLLTVSTNKTMITRPIYSTLKSHVTRMCEAYNSLCDRMMERTDNNE